MFFVCANCFRGGAGRMGRCCQTFSPGDLWCSSVVVALGNSSRSDHLFCHWMTRRWFCEAGSGVVFSAIVDHFIEWSILWVHTGTCAALNKACVAQCRHVGPFRDLMFGSRYLVPVFLHFSFAQRVAAEAGFSHLLLALFGLLSVSLLLS